MTVEWLSVPEFAERAGLSPAAVRDRLREGTLVAQRRGPNNAQMLPAQFIVPGDHADHVISTLKGTLTLLKDMAMTDDEVMAWLLEPHPDLGQAPLEALRQGQRSAVRRAAQTLL